MDTKINFKNIMQEKIVETKICKQCNQNFEITKEDLDLYLKFWLQLWEKKYDIPISDICHTCMEQNRLAWKNERKLYKRQCDITWKQIISMYSPDKNIKVYDYKAWDSDIWDPLNYWFSFDNSITFFTQFDKLLKSVPFKNLIINTSENCDYNNSLDDCKDCYMCFWNSKLEKTLFSDSSIWVKNSMEVSWSDWIENSYEILDCSNIYKSYFLNLCSSINNSYFCYDCSNCDYCFMCSWLNNKKYFILNKEYTKENYKKEVKKYLETPSYMNNCKKLFNELNLTIPKKSLIWINNKNSLWSNLFDSKDCKKVFNVVFWNNIRYSSDSWKNSDVMDSNVCYDWEWIVYNSIDVIWWFKVNNSAFITKSKYLNYCYYLQNCSNCFGCIWLKNKQYCILNKQYTKKEYETLVIQIIEKMIQEWIWWRFFPAKYSTFWYNETISNDYYNLEKQDALNKWFIWSDYEQELPKVEKIIPWEMLPNDIKDIPDDILNWAINCEITKKLFRIITMELEFYRKHNLPVPKKHPDQRFKERINLRNPRKLFDRKCSKCSKIVKSTYSSDREEIVYCEECYNKEFY